jgi:Zn-dependent peptidase ImmA (M78 family)
MIEFIPKKVIEKIAEENLMKYRTYKGESYIEFPLDIRSVFHHVFGLQTDFVKLPQRNFISEDEANKIRVGLYPDKFFFQGKDKVIVVNTDCTNITEEFCRFAIAHAGGHYALHFHGREISSYGVSNSLLHSSESVKPTLSEPIFCNLLDRYHPLEIQANYYASAILVPRGEIFRLVSTQKLLDLYQQTHVLCQKFGVSERILELRLQQLEAVLESDMQQPHPVNLSSASAEILKSLEKLSS